MGIAINFYEFLRAEFLGSVLMSFWLFIPAAFKTLIFRVVLWATVWQVMAASHAAWWISLPAFTMGLVIFEIIYQGLVYPELYPEKMKEDGRCL